ncbi:MAG: hypothetical protein WDN31_12995 [Hyphomicrobium sp.]
MRAPVRLSILGPCLLAITAIGPTTAARAQEVIDNETVSVPGDEPNPWNIGDDIVVGEFGTGTLNITAGGVVLSASGTLGDDPGSSGTVNATGLGALWDLNTENLYVGNDGSGALLISGGAHVEGVYSTYIAYGGSSTSTVTVTGGFSQLIMSNDIFVGQAGSGTLNVTAGGTFTAPTMRGSARKREPSARRPSREEIRFGKWVPNWSSALAARERSR